MQREDKFQWESTWEQHASWLRTVLQARLRNSVDADEVLQDVAVLAWRKREQLIDASRIEPWLYRIAISQVLMFWRKNKRTHHHVELSTHAESHEDHSTPDPADWVTKQEAHELVRKAMQRLPAQDREILLLKHVECWTYEQICNRLGITYDKVVYRVSRARDRLRRELVCNEMKSQNE